MEEKKKLTEEELEKVAGGTDIISNGEYFMCPYCMSRFLEESACAKHVDECPKRIELSTSDMRMRRPNELPKWY